VKYITLYCNLAQASRYYLNGSCMHSEDFFMGRIVCVNTKLCGWSWRMLSITALRCITTCSALTMWQQESAMCFYILGILDHMIPPPFITPV